MVAQIRTSAPPVVVAMGGRWGYSAAKGITCAVILTNSVDAKIGTLDPSVIVAMGGRTGATVTDVFAFVGGGTIIAKGIHSVGLMTSVFAQIKTSVLLIIVTMGGRAGATINDLFIFAGEVGGYYFY